MSSSRWLVIGAGGHGKVVLASLLELGETVVAVLDDEPSRWGLMLLGTAVRGPVVDHREAGDRAILAVGENSARRRLADQLQLDWRPVIHPTAHVHPTVRLGRGTFIAAGAVIQPDAVIGDHVIVNTGATIDHDCIIGSYAHLAPGSHLAGAVSVGTGSLVGLGAGATPGVRIGDWAVLGAGAMAVDDVASGVTVIGVPARAAGAAISGES